MSRCIALLMFLFAITTADAQDFNPPSAGKKSVATKEKSIPKNKLNNSNKKKQAKKKTAKRSAGAIEDNTYYETDTQETSLFELNDYELEVKAAQGDIDAQYAIGERWVFADNGNDLSKGMGWLTKASESNHPWAQSLLGFCYESLGDDKSAGYFYQKSANQGNMLGQYLLGQAYANGTCGMEQDFTQALNLFSLSGQQGLAPAQFAVGYYLYLGLGATRNLEYAKGWMQLAAENGNENAQNFLRDETFTDEAADAMLQKLASGTTEESESTNNTETSSATESNDIRPAGIEVNRTTTTDTHVWTLLSVDCKKDCTVLYWSVSSRMESTWVQSTWDEYITAGNSSERYYIKSCEGIAMQPSRTIMKDSGETIIYKTIFPAIPSKAKRISYYDQTSQFKNIDIRTK